MIVLKLVCKVVYGIYLEVEMSWYLMCIGYVNIVMLVGEVVYVDLDGMLYMVVIL